MLRAPSSSPPRASGADAGHDHQRQTQDPEKLRAPRRHSATSRAISGTVLEPGLRPHVARARNVTISTTAAPAAKKVSGTGRSSRPPIPWATRGTRIKE